MHEIRSIRPWSVFRVSVLYLVVLSALFNFLLGMLLARGASYLLQAVEESMLNLPTAKAGGF